MISGDDGCDFHENYLGRRYCAPKPLFTLVFYFINREERILIGICTSCYTADNLVVTESKKSEWRRTPVSRSPRRARPHISTAAASETRQVFLQFSVRLRRPQAPHLFTPHTRTSTVRLGSSARLTQQLKRQFGRTTQKLNNYQISRNISRQFFPSSVWIHNMYIV